MIEKSLSPEHIIDLKKSGLSEETIKAVGIRSVPPGQINKKIGWNLPGLRSMYEISYPGTDGFSRFRCFYEEGKTGPKYRQRKGTGNNLYIPSQMNHILTDANVALYFVEGEKKALKGIQEGLNCIGLPGLWGWKNKDEECLIPDFNKIAIEGRPFYIVPDNDYKQKNKHGYKKNLEQAVKRLAVALNERGARVFIVELPEGAAKGLDDYLCQHGVDDFKKLPKGEIQTDKKSNRKKETEIKTTLEANLPGLVDVVLDGDVPVFLFNRDGKITLEREVVISLDEKKLPPGKEHFPFPLLQAEEVAKAYQREDDALFDDVLSYLKRHSYLTEEQYLICTAYVFLTYIYKHKDVFYTPIILFFAVPERGKTRTGRAMIYISYRGVHSVDLRETNLFRFSHNLGATLFLDTMDVWRKAEKNGSEDVLLLRYEKGATVARVLWPEKGQFKDTKYFSVYGPTIIASNEALHKILSSRCIPFSMPNRPGFYENPTPEGGMPLRARLTAFRMRAMTATLPTVDTIDELTGRLWDICQPLLQICKMVQSDRYEDFVGAMIGVAAQRGDDSRESYEGQIVQILFSQFPDSVEYFEIGVKDVKELFNENLPPEVPNKTPHWIGKKLKALGLKTKRVGGNYNVLLSRDEIDILSAQYGLSDKSCKSCKSLTNEIHTDNEAGLKNSKVLQVLPKSCSVNMDNNNLFADNQDSQDFKDLRGGGKSDIGTGYDIEKELKIMQDNLRGMDIEDIVIDINNGNDRGMEVRK
jgi:hypothetical protein